MPPSPACVSRKKKPACSSGSAPRIPDAHTRGRPPRTRVELHARAVRRRPFPLQLVHERVDLLRDDGAELASRAESPNQRSRSGPQKVSTEANYALGSRPCSCATRPKKPPSAPRYGPGSRSNNPGLDGLADTEAKKAWSRKIYDAGYAGLTWPKEYGGQGASYSHQAIILEEWARAEAPGPLGVIGLGMAGPTIIAHGTEEQKQRYLANILSAEEIWCQGFSEPGRRLRPLRRQDERRAA